MQIEPFELERIQSLYENLVEINLSDSGVHPYSLNTLLTADERDALLDVDLGYGWTNGAVALRETIAGLYAELARVAPSAVVDLNHAVAISMTEGPDAALPLVDAAAATGRLDGYYLLHATRADLLRRLGRTHEAAESYRAALGTVPTDTERRYLEGRLRDLPAR